MADIPLPSYSWVAFMSKNKLNVILYLIYEPQFRTLTAITVRIEGVHFHFAECTCLYSIFFYFGATLIKFNEEKWYYTVGIL